MNTPTQKDHLAFGRIEKKFKRKTRFETRDARKFEGIFSQFSRGNGILSCVAGKDSRHISQQVLNTHAHVVIK